MKLIPEWCKPRSLVLVWPEQLLNRDKLIPFYKELISVLPSGVELTLILKDKKIEVKVSEELKKLNPGIDIKFYVITCVDDIWIRDWAPFLCKDENGKVIAAKMIYNPKYFKEEHRKYAERDNEAGYEIAAYFDYEIMDYEAIWDGGNLTHNGKNYGIVTEDLLNDEYMREDNIWNITADIGIEDLMAIEAEPGDVTKHTDGFIRFIDEKTLLIAAYPENYFKCEYLISKKEWEELKWFTDSLAEQFADEFKVVRVINSIPFNKLTEGMPNAIGNYVNYLRLGDKVLIPQYGLEEDEAAYNEFVNLFGADNVIKVSGEINKLADLGGVLNCISWAAY